MSYHWKSLAEHYGIFRDLFNNAIFYPSVNMNISYDYDDEYVSKVYIGNRLKPSEVSIYHYQVLKLLVTYPIILLC